MKALSNKEFGQVAELAIDEMENLKDDVKEALLNSLQESVADQAYNLRDLTVATIQEIWVTVSKGLYTAGEQKLSKDFTPKELGIANSAAT